jgi:hypothetical protein
VGSHFSEEPQTGHDSVVEIDEFSLGELVDIDLHQSSGLRVTYSINWSARSAQNELFTSTTSKKRECLGRWLPEEPVTQTSPASTA